MIRKFTLCAMILASSLSSFAAVDPVFQWAHSIDGDTSGGDSPIAVTKTTDGNYLLLSTFGSTSTALPVRYDATEIAQGAPYVTTTANNGNLLIQKIAPSTGNILWTAYSNRGDINNSSSMAATSDGGVVLTLKVRNTDLLDVDVLINIVDAAGTVTPVKWVYPKSRVYKGVMVRLDKDGKLKWTKYLNVSSAYTGVTDPETDGASFYATTVDASGNIYVSGSIRDTLTVAKADGTSADIIPANIKSWIATPKGTSADMFLAKFDADGNFLSSLNVSGTAANSSIDNLVFDSGKLYAQGHILGDNTLPSVTIGNQTLAIDSLDDELLLSINPDLTLNYAKKFIGTAASDTKHTHQNKGLQLIDGSIYLFGALKGGFADAAKTAAFMSSAGTKLEGFVIRANAADGSLSASAMQGAGISAYFGAMAVGDDIYVYGYSNAYKTCINVHSKSDLSKTSTTYTLVTYGTTSLCASPLIDGTNFVSFNRGGKGNSKTNVASFYGTTSTLTNLVNWGSVVSSYKIATSTGISNLTTQPARSNYDVYGIDGRLVRHADNADNALKGLSKGIYIIGKKKVIINQ